jgi:hypothetical protein
MFKRKYGMAPNEFRRRAGAHKLDESLFASSVLDMGIPPARALEATGRKGSPTPKNHRNG